MREVKQDANCFHDMMMSDEISFRFFAFPSRETITGGTGSVPKDTFITTVTVRNHTPSLRAWLEFWRIDELTETLEEL